jgi:uncharacterized protein YjcR
MAREFGCHNDRIVSNLKKYKLPRKWVKKPLDHEKIRSMYQQGMSVRSISDELGCSYDGVRGSLMRMGLKETDPNRWLDHDRIRELWMSGLGSLRIAKTIGASKSGVESAIRKMRRNPGVGRLGPGRSDGSVRPS